MKIGILTLPILSNYGGTLQAYALQQVLTDMGHDSWMIMRRQTPKSSLTYGEAFLKSLVKKILGREVKDIVMEGRGKLWGKESIIHPVRFIEKNIQPLTKYYYSSEELKEVSQYEFDAYIVGSDQVWRPQYTSCIQDYFFGFVSDDKVKRIAYAASFGTSEWEYSEAETKDCKKLLKLFDAISVRESDAVGMCEKHLECAAVHLLDPTMLLVKDRYLSLLDNRKKEDNSTPYLFTYVLDTTPEKELAISHLAAEKKLEINSMGLIARNTKLFKRTAIPSIEDWICSISKASCIITDSFHGCVFSILFNKPFAVFANKERGLSRFESLLSLFGLEDRIITGQIDKEKVCDILNTPIDWDRVNEVIERKRDISLEFLKANLK